MRYAEKVLLHNLVQQTIKEKDAYEALSGSADARLWFMDKQEMLSVLDGILERYINESGIIVHIAEREILELPSKNNKDDDAVRLYHIQADLLTEVMNMRDRMIEKLISIRHSLDLFKRFAKKDIVSLISLADCLITKLRDLSDVAELLEKYDIPEYKQFYKSK